MIKTMTKPESSTLLQPERPLDLCVRPALSYVKKRALMLPMTLASAVLSSGSYSLCVSFAILGLQRILLLRYNSPVLSHFYTLGDNCHLVASVFYRLSCSASRMCRHISSSFVTSDGASTSEHPPIDNVSPVFTLAYSLFFQYRSELGSISSFPVPFTLADVQRCDRQCCTARELEMSLRED
jgi:hypothetical protein